MIDTEHRFDAGEPPCTMWQIAAANEKSPNRALLSREAALSAFAVRRDPLVHA